MKVAIAFSLETESELAGRTAALSAVETSGEPRLMIVFITDEYNPEEVLRGIKSVVNETKIVGFCCAGIITNAGIHKQGVGICALSGNFSATTAIQKELSANPFATGERIAETLLASGIKRGTAIVLPDGFQANLSEMLRGLYNKLGPSFNYIGGGAGDNLKFFKTWQFTEVEVASDAVAVALIEGIDFSIGVGHGWYPVGSPVVVTRAKGKIVYEINAIPAYQAYSKLIGCGSKEEFKVLGMMHPLGFPDIAGRYIIRDPLGVNDDDSITFVTEIPSHSVGSIMDCEIDELIDTAVLAAKGAVSQLPDHEFSLVFDCISRVLLFGNRFPEEIAALQTVIDSKAPFLGALTFGEIGSYGSVPLLHNKTTVVSVGRKTLA
ncbi:MAG: FIST C-terminal domain-containing protein [Candidatus Riflebacteria bacterium]|nr:FIST C-terminal domain-containing protein [Candidatus Riflebacteria bacterium]